MRFSRYALLSIALLNGCQLTGQKDPEKKGTSNNTIHQSAFFVNHTKQTPNASPQTQKNVWDRIAMQLSFPIPENEKIQHYRNWYIKHPRHLKIVAERARPFLHLITERVEARNIPLEIALLPIVESSFDQHAYSHVRAAGLWQFVPETARRFGLDQTWWYDGRRDVVESTEAALDLLEYLHKKFDGDWLHALAAYNTGEGRVFRAIRSNEKKGKPTDFWSLRLPKETSGYVPKLIAIADVLKNRDKYGVEFKPIANKPAVKVINPEVQMELAVAARLAGLPLKTLQNLNPAYNRWATSPNGNNHFLLPIENIKQFEENLAKTQTQEVNITRYKVKSGDALVKIAKAHNTSVDSIKRANDLSDSMIKIGQQLLVPISNKFYRDKPRTLALGSRNLSSTNVEKISYTVVSGDNLWSIAKAYNISHRELASWNNLSLMEPLRIGKKITILKKQSHNRANVRTIVYQIKSGDSLSTIAYKYNVTVNELAKWNMLDKNSLIKPGQKLTVHVDINQA